MPPGSADTPRRIPLGDTFLCAFAPLPDDEIARVVLGVLLVALHPTSQGEVPRFQIDQPSVIREASDGEVHGTIALVGQLASLEALHELDHRRNVLGRPGVVLHAFEPQRLPVLEELALDRTGHLLQRSALRDSGVDRPIVDVGEVHDLRNAEPAKLQVPTKQILPDEGPEVADVGPLIDGGSAAVDPGVARLERLEFFELPAQGVVES